jgi:hypothetical protein
LNFFREKPKLFLMRIPLPVTSILNYHNPLYISYIVTKFFISKLHLASGIRATISER